MDYTRARLNMVANQLRPNQIVDPRLLDAMREVPRERFVPKLLRGVAYADEDLLLPGGGHLVEPLALARLIQAARIRPHEVVLVLGCSTGYSGAGHPSQAPFDVILLVGSVEVVPPALWEQIGDGGRLVAVIDDGRVGKGTVFTRLHGVIGKQVVFDAQIPPLPGLRTRAEFAF